MINLIEQKLIGKDIKSFAKSKYLETKITTKTSRKFNQHSNNKTIIKKFFYVKNDSDCPPANNF